MSDPKKSKHGWFYEYKCEIQLYPNISCVFSLGSPWQAWQCQEPAQQGPGSPQLHRRNEIWEGNDVTGPGRSQMDVLRAVIRLILCFPRIISTSHPRTEATLAGWDGKMDTHCSGTGLQPL